MVWYGTCIFFRFSAISNLVKNNKAQFGKLNLLTFMPPFLNLCGKHHRVKVR